MPNRMESLTSEFATSSAQVETMMLMKQLNNNDSAITPIQSEVKEKQDSQLMK